MDKTNQQKNNNKNKVKMKMKKKKKELQKQQRCINLWYGMNAETDLIDGMRRFEGIEGEIAENA